MKLLDDELDRWQEAENLRKFAVLCIGWIGTITYLHINFRSFKHRNRSCRLNYADVIQSYATGTDENA
jgi:hypothetical protein